jgi:hypothetical protein
MFLFASVAKITATEAKMPGPEVVEILNELSQRLRRLEEKTSRRRGSLNQKQAAEYLNRSEEWLRREHAAGRGPRRRRRGSRNWEYLVEDLDAYATAEGDD